MSYAFRNQSVFLINLDRRKLVT